MLHKLTALIFKWFNPGVTLARGVKIDPRAFLARGGPIVIGEDSLIRAGAMLLPSGGSITIGRRTGLNQYVVMNGEGGIQIGDDVMIAAFVAIYAANHRIDRTDICMREQGMYSKGGVIIEDDVWIGTHCVVLDGVRIGRGSVIAAGAVVTKNVLPYSIIQGVPGRLVGSRKDLP